MLTKYKKLVVAVGKSSEKLYVCKEDKESFTKTKIMLIAQLFRYLLSLDFRALARHVSMLEVNGFKLLEFAI